jgi:hypothetical protein
LALSVRDTAESSTHQHSRQEATGNAPKRPRRATKSATRFCQPDVTPQGGSDPNLAGVASLPPDLPDTGPRPSKCYPPGLADVVAAWPDLPDPIKAAVLALVRTARGGGR